MEDNHATRGWKDEMAAVPIVGLNEEVVSSLLEGQGIGDGRDVKQDCPIYQDISNNFHPFWYCVVMDGNIPIRIPNIFH